MKKVSLILTTYNCAANLKRTLESIDQQDYPAVEIVVKDGKSSDDTLSIIRNYEQNGKYNMVWESSADEGLYDAMNRGYQMSDGDIIAIFNERFLTFDAISKLACAMEAVDENGKERYIGAHCDLVYMDGDKSIRRWKMGEGSIKQGWLPGHPTLFIKREIYERYGLYNTQYKISADYEFMIRFLKDEKNHLAYVPETLVGMYYGGTSTSSLKSYIKSFKEGHKALKENGINMALLIDLKRTMRVLRQFIN